MQSQNSIAKNSIFLMPLATLITSSQKSTQPAQKNLSIYLPVVDSCKSLRRLRAIPENREFQKWKLSFFHQRHALLTSFDIFVITYRVTNFLPKLLDMLLFSTEKTEFPFLVFPYFRVMPQVNDIYTQCMPVCRSTCGARFHICKAGDMGPVSEVDISWVASRLESHSVLKRSSRMLCWPDLRTLMTRSRNQLAQQQIPGE